MRNYALKLGAVFGFISVITTLGVHLIPVQASNFEESVMLYKNSTYIFSRWWIIFHCFAVMVSMTGVYIAINTPFNIHAKIGIIGFLVFVWAEITRMLLSLTYLFNLRKSYVEQADPLLRSILKSDIQNFSSVGNGLFVMFALGFAIGNFFFGIELFKQKGLGRWVGCMLVFWFCTGMLAVYSEFRPVDGLDGFFSVYSITFQPLVRALTALWLWKQIRSSEIPMSSPAS